MPARKGTLIRNARPRTKGSLNKITRSAKEAFEYAFDKLGGRDGLAAWGKKNKGEFYRIYGRHFLPTNVKVEVAPQPMPEGPIATLDQATELYRRVMGDPSLDIAQIEFAAPGARAEVLQHLPPDVVAEVPAPSEVPVNTDRSNVVELGDRQKLWERLGQ